MVADHQGSQHQARMNSMTAPALKGRPAMTKAPFGLAFAAILAALGTATAQEWPSRPLTMVVPFAAGGTGDVYGRILATRLAELLALMVWAARRLTPP